jgi:arylsulfatase A-like enzyme
MEDRRLLERTWILFTSDHGDGQGDMFHWRKGYPYEFSAHVPMVLRWPQEWASKQPAGSLQVARGSVVAPPLVAELRDVFHTLADAAGISRNSSLMPPQLFHKADGRSLLCLLRDPTGMRHCDYPPNPGRWRRWVDMEHGTCFNSSNHWSALTDGRSKYVYIASLAEEQLFNLSADPHEGVDLSRSARHQAELALWRGRLISQFEAEGRGDAWVKGGALVQRAQAMDYSPNYPGRHPLSGKADPGRHPLSGKGRRAGVDPMPRSEA